MAVYSFRRCFSLSNNDTTIIATQIVAQSRSIPGNKTTFYYEHFWNSYLTCLNSHYPEYASHDFLYTPSGYPDDCRVVRQNVLWAACLESLCGVVPQGNTKCDLLVEYSQP